MARIRSIKPEFFTSIVVARVSLAAAFTFAGLWTHCDDAGRAIDDARLIKAALFPLRDEITPAEIEAYLCELAEQKLLVRYHVAGRAYLAVPEDSWKEHQKIDRPRPSKLPAPPDTTKKPRRTIVEDSSTPRRRKGKEGIGIGKGQGEGTETRAIVPPASRVTCVEQEKQLRAAAMPHEALAFDVLLQNHPNPDFLVLELHATASGLHVVRGQATGKPADIADVMRAIAEMAATGKEFSVPLFRGFVRRIADRPPEPASVAEREIAKLNADIAKRAAIEPTRGERDSEGRISVVTIAPEDTDAAREQRRLAREEAMAMFRREAGLYDAKDPAKNSTPAIQGAAA